MEFIILLFPACPSPLRAPAHCSGRCSAGKHGVWHATNRPPNPTVASNGRPADHNLGSSQPTLPRLVRPCMNTEVSLNERITLSLTGWLVDVTYPKPALQLAGPHGVSGRAGSQPGRPALSTRAVNRKSAAAAVTRWSRSTAARAVEKVAERHRPATSPIGWACRSSRMPVHHPVSRTHPPPRAVSAITTTSLRSENRPFDEMNTDARAPLFAFPQSFGALSRTLGPVI